MKVFEDCLIRINLKQKLFLMQPEARIALTAVTKSIGKSKGPSKRDGKLLK